MCWMSNEGVDTWILTEVVLEIEELGKVPSCLGSATLAIRDVAVPLHLYTVVICMDSKKPFCQDYEGNKGVVASQSLKMKLLGDVWTF